MTITYKNLTPSEAAANWIHDPGRVRARKYPNGMWLGISSDFTIGSFLSTDYSFRLVIEPKPETVEDIISGWPCLTTPEDRVKWLRRLVAAVKHELREELKK